MIPWGPTGQLVYERTYSRLKPNGDQETWPETVRRVVDGNLALAGKHEPGEREDLIEFIENFKILPAGRHLWASGVPGRQFLFNCHVSGWGEDITEHFEFTFLRLMEGGGVGSNYSSRFLNQYPLIESDYTVHIVCDPGHPDYQKLKAAGVISSDYDSGWQGAFEVEDSREGWAAALTDLLSTYYRHAKNKNRVFDVSRVRAEGSRLKTFGGRASGPLPLALMLHEVANVMNDHVGERLSGLGAMEIDHAIAKCVVSGGNRRSARMAIMHWDDPQIWEFLECKRDSGQHWTTNISVEVDSEFWSYVKQDAADERQAKAHRVLAAIAEGMLSNGEPGIWDSSLSNENEPNEVIATNPCGEIALEAWENCNLGHVNLSKFVDDGEVDFAGLAKAHKLITRFLIRATYGDVNDSKQAEKLSRNRRIGVGHLGFASMLAKMGIRYSDAPDHQGIRNLLDEMAEEVDYWAGRYAHELRIPVPVKRRTVAPTGTIAKLSGDSEGIHPVFAKYFIRRVRFSTLDPEQRERCLEMMNQGYRVEEDLYAENTLVVNIPTTDILLGEVADRYGEDEAEWLVQSAADLTLRDMLRVQQMYQKHWADNAVSFTANINPDRYSTEELVQIITEFGGSLKGTTIFPERSRPQSPYERITREEFEGMTGPVSVADSVGEDCANGACPVR